METVRQILKKTNSAVEEEGMVHPQSGEFVALEDAKPTTRSVRWCVLTRVPSS